MLLLHAVLLVFGVSLLALVLRSLFLIDGLISAALILFALGVTGLIAGATCLLIDISQGNSGGDTLSYSLAKILTQLSQQILPTAIWTMATQRSAHQQTRYPTILQPALSVCTHTQ